MRRAAKQDALTAGECAIEGRGQCSRKMPENPSAGTLTPLTRNSVETQ
jgi:hypothetical protein